METIECEIEKKWGGVWATKHAMFPDVKLKDFDKTWVSKKVSDESFKRPNQTTFVYYPSAGFDFDISKHGVKPGEVLTCGIKGQKGFRQSFEVLELTDKTLRLKKIG